MDLISRRRPSGTNATKSSRRAAAGAAARLDDRVGELEVRVRSWAAETDALPAPDMATTGAVANLETQVQQLVGHYCEFVRDLARVRKSVAQLEPRMRTGIDEQVREIIERTAADNGADAERDAALRRTRDALAARMGEIQALSARIERGRYQRLTLRIREIVERQVPRGAVVMVISRGDDELLAFPGRRGWHFPQTGRNVYAGHHPADSKTAIAHVEQLRARGARYLLVPRTAFWWFDHYREFSDHLQRNFRCVFRDERTCALFSLRGRRAR